MVENFFSCFSFIFTPFWTTFTLADIYYSKFPKKVIFELWPVPVGTPGNSNFQKITPDSCSSLNFTLNILKTSKFSTIPLIFRKNHVFHSSKKSKMNFLDPLLYWDRIFPRRPKWSRYHDWGLIKRYYIKQQTTYRCTHRTWWHKPHFIFLRLTRL